MKRLLCLLTALSLFACGCTSDSDTAKPTTTTTESTVATTTAAPTTTTVETTVVTTTKKVTTAAPTTATPTTTPAKVKTSPLRWRQFPMHFLMEIHLFDIQIHAEDVEEIQVDPSYPGEWGTWLDWQTKGDFFYVMCDAPDCYKVVVFDGENACVAQEAYIPEIPYRMQLANNALWISFPHVRKIGVFPLAEDNTINEDAYYELDIPSIAYPFVPVHYAETTAYTFDVYGDYIVYNTGSYIVRYNYKTGEAVPKAGKGDEYFYKHGVPESADILIDPKLNAFYMSYKSDDLALDMQLGVFDLETFALKDTVTLSSSHAKRLYLSQDILFADNWQCNPHLGFHTTEGHFYRQEGDGEVIYANDVFAITTSTLYAWDTKLQSMRNYLLHGSILLSNDSGDILLLKKKNFEDDSIIFLPCV